MPAKHSKKRSASKKHSGSKKRSKSSKKRSKSSKNKMRFCSKNSAQEHSYHFTMSAHDSALKDKYPNLWKFVSEIVLPDELEKIDSVVQVYTDKILERISEIPETGESLQSIVQMCAPYPGWSDPGSSGIWNATIEQSETPADMLMKVLKKDKIKIGK